jgi:hypothetical protein
MRLLFEGPSIETLLARVRDEHGPGARIVAADKVRSGGIAGFFTRERYAITVVVEPGDTAPEEHEPKAAVERPLDAPGTLLELADVIDAAEAAESHVVMSTAAMPGTAVAVPSRAATFSGAPARVATRPPTLSTDGPEFAAVLASWAQAADPSPVFTALETTSSFVPATLTRVAPTTTPARVAADVTCRLDSELSRRLLGLGLPRELVDRVAADTGSSGLRDTLAKVLSEALPKLPAPGLRPGDVLVIAGDGAEAFELAGTVAKHLKLDPTKVLLAATSALGTGINPSRLLSGPTDARKRSERMHRADVATIVAIDAPCGGESAVWASDVADALGARLMWALVDATTKPADLTDHFANLGRLDGIAVRATGASRDPATVLRPVIDLMLPTMWLERRPGNPKAWASLLADRVGD